MSRTHSTRGVTSTEQLGGGDETVIAKLIRAFLKGLDVKGKKTTSGM